jgi:hypothetical protein
MTPMQRYFSKFEKGKFRDQSATIEFSGRFEKNADIQEAKRPSAR